MTVGTCALQDDVLVTVWSCVIAISLASYLSLDDLVTLVPSFFVYTHIVSLVFELGYHRLTEGRSLEGSSYFPSFFLLRCSTWRTHLDSRGVDEAVYMNSLY